ncbi:PLDc N-terminal domain-containing protein [Bernardetia sp. OM2101]|uniref:PLDc N-terminal domain-containing protein n=1 Tax=Bernardetia sp. OM2101 TaxID=3344876 RepID=UPI0035CF1995
MSKSKKIWLGIFTFSPLIVTILAIVTFIGAFMTFASTTSNQQNPPDDVIGLFFGGFFVFFVLILLASLADLGITIYYIIDIVKDESVDETEKIIWVLALFFGSFISTAVYYFVRIWNRKKGGILRNNEKYKMADF